MSRSRIRFLSLLFAFGWSTVAFGADGSAPTSGFRERYPVTVLDSTAKADAALADAKSERALVEREYRTTSRACMDKFLVNDCLNAAREVQRKRLADVSAVEIDANRFKRRDRGSKSDADLARRESERAANDKADADLRARNKSTFDSRQDNAQRDAGKTGTRTASTPKKPPIEKDAAAAAVQRAQNVDAHTEKVEDAAEHREDLMRRRAEKVAERKRRAVEKTQKAAKAAAT